jgi:hypothetical protein
MSSTLTNLTAATTWSGTDLFYATVAGNSRKIAAFLDRPAADILEQKNSTSVQIFRLYYSFTNTSNYQRLALTGGADNFNFAAETLGTGADNIDISFIPAGTGACKFLSEVITTGALTFYPTSTLIGEASNVIAQRNSTFNQIFRVYRAWIDSSNYERLALQTGSGYLEIAAETAGSGTDDLDVRLTPAGAGNVKFFAATATPASGSTTARITFGSTAGFGIYIGSGAPTVSAAQGSLYLNSTGSSSSTRLYVNSTGSTTWVAVTTAS